MYSNPSNTVTSTTRSKYAMGLAAALCLLLPLAIYFRTLAPTVYTFDSGEFATGAFSLGIIHPTGYPFYLLVAKLFTWLPVGDIAYRVNLMSALFGAISVSLLFVICRRLTGNAIISAAAALLYAFSFYYWREAVIAETYTLNTALLLILLLLFLKDASRRSFLEAGLAGLVFGLGLANHMSTILLIPALLYWGVVNRESLKSILGFALFSAGGLLLYLYLPVRYVANPPLNYAATYLRTDLTTPAGIWSWMTGETFRQFMLGYSAIELLGEAATYLAWLWSNFLGAGVLIGLVGLAAMLRRNPKTFILLTIIYLSYTAFFINYRVVNKDTMFSVSYLVWTIWIAYGAMYLSEFLKERRLLKFGVPAFLAAIALVALLANYAPVDQSHNTMARDFAGQLLDQVAPSAFVITEWTWATPLEYLQIVENRRPDVTIYDRGLAGLGVWSQLRQQGVPDEQATILIEDSLVTVISREIATRPVYATAYDADLATRFDFISLGRYYRLRARPMLGMLPEPAEFRSGN